MKRQKMRSKAAAIIKVNKTFKSKRISQKRILAQKARRMMIDRRIF